MAVWYSRTFATGFLLVATITLVGGNRLNLKAYSEDTSCSKVVYADIGPWSCPDVSTCRIEKDDSKEFHDTVSYSCIADRDAYLQQQAFWNTLYLSIEIYGQNCIGEVRETASYLADGKCHPYVFGHFKIAEGANGKTSVFTSSSGCGSNDWIETWSAVTTTQVNTGACITDGMDSWKSYLVKGSNVTVKSTDSTALNDTVTFPPTTTTTTPTTTTNSPMTTSPTSSTATTSTAVGSNSSSPAACVHGILVAFIAIVSAMLT